MKHKYLNNLELSRENLIFNYKYLSSLDANLRIAPVFKSNAYGHGIKEVSSVIDRLHTPFICVNDFNEALELWHNSVKTKILIMGFIDQMYLITPELPFSYAVYNFEQISLLNTYQPHSSIHLFVDTGMHREGIPIADLDSYIKYINTKTDLWIEGLMSHFAMADHPESILTLKQVQTFERAKKICNRNHVFPKYVHISASSAVLNYSKYLHLGNIARVGIALFGIAPVSININLKPVLKFLSTITQVKNIEKGEYVGYDFTYEAKKSMKIAILSAGFNDGITRSLSNKGYVQVKGVMCPIIGRVSMNITTIDITQVKDVSVGDKVIIYSNNPTDKNSMYNSAKISGHSPYELLVQLNKNQKRIVV